MARGLLALVLGVAVLLWPDVSLEATLFGFAAFAFVYGVLSLASVVRHSGARFPPLVEGLAGIGFAVSAIAWPEGVGAVAVFAIAAWAVVVGGVQVATAYRRRAAITDEWLQATAGAATLLFGLVLLARSALGGPALPLLVGAYAVGFGVLAVAFAVEARRRAGAA